jgi:hypothetical protein
MATRYKAPEYITWDNMIQRCINARNPAFPNYGGRGISVCGRWSLYSNFIADMGTKPSPDYEIERIDNNGDYTPENCKWIPAEQQGRNKRTYKTNTTGISGVQFSQKQQIYRVKVEGMYIYNGKDFFEACCKRKAEDARVTRRYAK